MTFIQTTHVGSLPRSAGLAEMLLKRDHAEDVNEAEFDALVASEIEQHDITKKTEWIVLARVHKDRCQEPTGHAKHGDHPEHGNQC